MFRRKRKTEDFQEEIRAHIELEADRLRQQGMGDEEALTAAYRAFGNVAQTQERFYESARVLWWDRLTHDIRYGARMLRKSPSFTAIAVLTMALGIGATTAIFSVVNATLLHPLPYPQPEQLVRLEDDLPGVGSSDVGFSEPEWQDLEHSGIFQHVSPDWYDDNNLTGASVPMRVSLSTVAPNYFALLGVKPQLGRTFDVNNHGPGYTQEVVISDGLWKRAFGGDKGILDRSIRMDTDLYRIVGVMPADFRPPGRTVKERGIEVWAACNFYGAPLADHPPRKLRNIPTSIARIQGGLTIEEAQTRVNALVERLQKEYPEDYPRLSAWRIRLLPLKDTVVGNVKRSLLLMMGAVGLVLLLGCVNIANLLLARSSARTREIAVRQALGASRRRLLGQLITESVLLSMLGGIAAVVVLGATERFLLRLLPKELPRVNNVTIDWTVLVFAIAISLVAGVLFGLAPAFHAGRFELTGALKSAVRGSSSGGQVRTRRALVITEFAVSLVLMIAAGLLLRSFRDLVNVQLGYDPEHVIAVQTRFPYPNVAANDRYKTPAQQAPFFREVLRRIRTLTGVEDAAMGNVTAIPLDHPQRDLNLLRFVFDRSGTQKESARVNTAIVTPEYFRVLRMTLLRGRVFTDFDDDKTPHVALVNESMARTHWPNEQAVGKHFHEERGGNLTAITVVGVVADVRTESLEDARVPHVYLSLYQEGAKHLSLLLRGSMDAGAAGEEVHKIVQSVDATLPVFNAETLDSTVSSSLAQRRFALQIVGMFAVTAIFLAAIGIYGVISYVVTERTREVGIRLALGARRGAIMRMVLREGLSLAAAGAATGLVAGMAVAEGIKELLYGVKPIDVTTFVAVPLVLILIAVAACVVPARRAVRVDPMVALRYE